MISDFMKQFVELEEENVRLKLEFEEAKKLAADARLKADIAENDNAKMKKILDKEIASREEAKAKIEEKEVQLRNTVESLLSKFLCNLFMHCCCPSRFSGLGGDFSPFFISSSCCRYP